MREFFDSDLFWNIWYNFIVYGIWVLFTLNLLHKSIILIKLKSFLGKGYSTLPELKNLSKWRKILIYFMLITVAAMIVVALLKSVSPFNAIPVLIITGIIYVNGKLKKHIFNFAKTLFYSKKGFVVYPSFFRLFSIRKFIWENVISIKVDNDSAYPELSISLKNGKTVRIRCAEKDLELYQNVFNEKELDVER